MSYQLVRYPVRHYPKVWRRLFFQRHPVHPAIYKWRIAVGPFDVRRWAD